LMTLSKEEPLEKLKAVRKQGSQCLTQKTRISGLSMK